MDVKFKVYQKLEPREILPLKFGKLVMKLKSLTSNFMVYG